MYDELRKGGGRCVMVRTREWKLIYFKDERIKDADGVATDSLYNLKDDPGESRNLYGKAEFNDIVNALKDLAERWEKS
jgi:arylsulfatase A-like enzyme